MTLWYNKTYRPAIRGSIAQSLLIILFQCQAASAQAIMETGNLYSVTTQASIPAIPHQQALTRSYGAPAAVPGAGRTYDLEAIESQAKKANSLYALAVKRHQEGKLSEAQGLYGQSLAIRMGIWGVADPAVYKIATTIGQLCVKQNKMPQAEDAYRTALKSAVKLYGPGTFDLCPALSRLGGACAEQMKYGDAVSCYSQVLALSERKLGAQNQSVVELRAKLDLLKERSQAARAAAVNPESPPPASQ